MSESARLRIAVVGPTHPDKGGLAAHTTALAHELAQAGHDVAVVSWRATPLIKRHRALGAVPDGSPDVEPFPATTRPLSWARPDTWWRTGRSLQDADVVLVVHVIPAVVPAHLALVRAARGGDSMPTIVALVHNVLPHEGRPGDEALMRRFLGAVDAVLVHSAAQATAAHDLGAADVSVAALPPHLPGGEPLARPHRDGPVSLLALGVVRDDKGLDLVLEALREVPDLRLTIAGELWGAAGERVRRLARDPGVVDRVTLREGYVPADQIAPLLAEHDALVLAYRSTTGSQNVLLAHHHGLPVLATDVGTLGKQVRHSVDGLVIPPEDHEALVVALRRLADHDLVEELRHGIRPPDLSGPWARYVAAIETIAAVRSVSAEGDSTEDSADASQPAEGAARLVERASAATAALTSSARSIATLARSEVDLHNRDLPEWVRPSDVLGTHSEAADVVALARSLGLPWTRPRGSVAAWAALGAISAVLRVRDGERRASVIVDSSGPSSVFSRWARAIGYAPVALDTADRDLDPGSLDVIARLHPHGCTGADIDTVLGQASRLLRRGGLVTVTIPVAVHEPGNRAVDAPRRRWHRLGGSAAGARGSNDAALLQADLRAVVARADTLGLSLVGDLDRDIAPRLSARPDGTTPGAYALVRLTFRRTGA
ncbi:MAG: glycosyltransferase [Dermatophilaceae bacterium]